MFKSLIRQLLPKKIKPHPILRGPLKGKRICTSWYDYPAAILGYTEKDLIRWIYENVNNGETWLDVGAHYGYTAIALSERVGASGRVFAFEPMISTAGQLTKTRKINRLEQMRVIPLALGKAERFTVKKLPSTRGMVDSTLDKEGVLEFILVTSLDWIWPHICGNNSSIDGIKIDVQGMEVEAISGMMGILKREFPTLVLEFHSGVNREQLLNIIEEVGYHGKPYLIGCDNQGGCSEGLVDRSVVFRP